MDVIILNTLHSKAELYKIDFYFRVRRLTWDLGFTVESTNFLETSTNPFLGIAVFPFIAGLLTSQLNWNKVLSTQTQGIINACSQFNTLSTSHRKLFIMRKEPPTETSVGLLSSFTACPKILQSFKFRLDKIM